MVPPLFFWTPECFLQVIHHSYSGVRSANYAPCVSKIASSRYKFANLCYKFSLHERGLSADWKAEREARSPKPEARPTSKWTCGHFGKWPPPCTPTRSIVLRQNSESTELHSLTMLQTSSQAVDLKVDRHFGEGQEYRNAEATAALREKTA